MLLTDLRELQSVLEIDVNDTQENTALNFYIEWCSAWIEEWLNRGDLSLKSRTEYYNGTGTQKLVLRSRPVYLTPTVNLDESGFFGSSSGSFDTSNNMVYGTDFCLDLDPGEDGTSRSGILIRLRDYWPKPSVRQRGCLTPFVGDGFGSVKVTYNAGYTVDTLPSQIRLAANLMVMKLRFIMPLGLELTSDSYEEKTISADRGQAKNYLMSLIKPMLFPFQNRRYS